VFLCPGDVAARPLLLLVLRRVDHDVVDDLDSELPDLADMHLGIHERGLGEECLELGNVAEVLAPVEPVEELLVDGLVRLRANHVQDHQLASGAEQLAALVEQPLQIVVGEMVGGMGDQDVVEIGLFRELGCQDVEAVEAVVGLCELPARQRDELRVGVDTDVVEVAEDVRHVPGRAADLQDPSGPLDVASDRPPLRGVVPDEGLEGVPEAPSEGDSLRGHADAPAGQGLYSREPWNRIVSSSK